MTLKFIYLGLCIVGTVLPISQFLPFLRDHGLDLPLFFHQLFSTPVGGFFGMDVFVSSIVLWVFVLAEGRRLGMRHLWGPIAANSPLAYRSDYPSSYTCERGTSAGANVRFRRLVAVATLIR